jgi:uncharacterized protein (UPF0332 family)
LVSAVNRAYFAIFDAARAALGAVDPKLLKTKTHATVVRRFGKHLVEERGFDRSLGRAFSQIEDLRLAVDYENEEVDDARVQKAIEDAERFIAAVDEFTKRGSE